MEVEINNLLTSNQLDGFEILGTGNQADVFLGYFPNSSEKYAIKKFKQNQLREFAVEVEALSSLIHPNIIRLCESNLKTRQLAIEYCSYKDLIDLLKRLDKGRLPESVGKYFFRQLISGLNHMHEENFAHRDIKLDNLMINSQCELKIADFGHSKKVQEGKSLTARVSTKLYSAPELLNRQEYNPKKIDIFAAGVSIFGTVIGKFPFSQSQKDKQTYSLFLMDQNEYWNYVQNSSDISLSEEFKDLMLNMLSEDPNNRLSADKILNHPWLQNPCSRDEAINFISSSLLRKEK